METNRKLMSKGRNLKVSEGSVGGHVDHGQLSALSQCGWVAKLLKEVSDLRTKVSCHFWDNIKSSIKKNKELHTQAPCPHRPRSCDLYISLKNTDGPSVLSWLYLSAVSGWVHLCVSLGWSIVIFFKDFYRNDFVNSSWVALKEAFIKL